MMGLDGAVMMFDGTAARLIHAFPDQQEKNWAGGVARADDGTLFASRNVSTEVVVVTTDDRVDRVRLESNGNAAMGIAKFLFFAAIAIAVVLFLLGLTLFKKMT